MAKKKSELEDSLASTLADSINKQFKGGVYCRHKWQQVLYKMKLDAALDGKKGSGDLKYN